MEGRRDAIPDKCLLVVLEGEEKLRRGRDEPSASTGVSMRAEGAR